MTTKIEWTDETWNPVTGCSKVSQGCHFCYAERLWPKVEGSRVKREGGAPRAFTDVRCHPERLEAPLHWRTPRRIFVNSMSDLFHDDVPDRFIADVFGVMAAAPQHQFQILTKRPMRMWELLEASKPFIDCVEECAALYTHTDVEWPLANAWLGVSVEDQATADERIPLLLQTPAAIRFVSYEPALGPVNFTSYVDPFLVNHKSRTLARGVRLNWIIAGGESGTHARPSHPDWFRSARDQCADAGVAYFFKQWGEWANSDIQAGFRTDHCFVRRDGTTHSYADNQQYEASDALMHRVSKRSAGRLLDGREHSEYPG